MAYTSSNPVLSNNFWNSIEGHQSMTYEGVMQKIGILFGTTLFVAAMVLYSALTIDIGIAFTAMMGGMFGGIAIMLALFLIRPKNPVPLMMTYAVFEGAFIGGISLFFESMYEGIVFQAGIGTLSIVAGMYGLYASRIIKATPMFQRVVISLTLGIMILYAISIILYLIPGSIQVPFLHTSGAIGIGLTLFILVVAALNLVLDFNFIENGIKQRTPKVGEWWGAFGLLVTVIWIYVEMLRLLSKVRSNMN